MSKALFTDLYEINMCYTYWKDGLEKRRAVFEAFFRELPFAHPFAVYAGLQRLVEYLLGFRFQSEDLAYLEQLGYEPAFLDYLAGMHFSGDLYSLQEGEIVFPREPMFRLEGELALLQILETAMLNIVNFQSLIATKASRVREAAGQDPLMEFGSRRAHEADAAVWGARAAYIGGFDGTSNLECGLRFGVPVRGTHAHSFVQVYVDELRAFERYLETHDHISLLIDTYDTLQSGIRNAITAARRAGRPLDSVRIDSGDLVELSKSVREILDSEGFADTRIIGSNDLDEYQIYQLKRAGARIDMWGIGTRIITAYDQPALGGVYKLVAIEDESGQMLPSMKRSSSIDKATLPGAKSIVRRLEHRSARGDIILLADEDPAEAAGSRHSLISEYCESKDGSLFLPLKSIIEKGQVIMPLPSATESRTYHQLCRRIFSDYGWVDNAGKPYPVEISSRLVQMQQACMKQINDQIPSLAGPL